MIFLRASARPAYSGASLSARYFSNNARFWPSEVQNSVTFGWFSLEAARNSGVFITEFKWPTTPQARPSFSVASSRGCTKLSHVTCCIGASSRFTTARACCSNASMAGVTCSGRIASKRGRAEKSSNGLSGFCKEFIRSGSFGGFYSVNKQHRDRHRSDASGHRSDITGHFLHIGKIDIDNQLAVIAAIDADVDHHCAGLDHAGGDGVFAADRGHDDVGLACEIRKIRGATMAYGDSGGGLQ